MDFADDRGKLSRMCFSDGGVASCPLVLDSDSKAALAVGVIWFTELARSRASTCTGVFIGVAGGRPREETVEDWCTMSSSA